MARWPGRADQRPRPGSCHRHANPDPGAGYPLDRPRELSNRNIRTGHRPDPTVRLIERVPKGNPPPLRRYGRATRSLLIRAPWLPTLRQTETYGWVSLRVGSEGVTSVINGGDTAWVLTATALVM